MVIASVVWRWTMCLLASYNMYGCGGCLVARKDMFIGGGYVFQPDQRHRVENMKAHISLSYVSLVIKRTL